MHIAKKSLVGTVAAAALVSSPVFAEDAIVKAAVTRWSPKILFIQPGDSVTWTNMAGHDVASIEGLIPEGAKPWTAKMGEPYTHKFTVPGAYVYKCIPHASLGMEGVVVVGDGTPANLDAIKNSPKNKSMIGLAIRTMQKALDKRKAGDTKTAFN